MAWNEPGNGKDPWKSGGDQPPDLDEVFRKIQDRLGGLFGGKRSRSPKGKGGSGLSLLVLLLVVVWLVIDSFYIIDQPERGVVLRFGKHVKTMQPGPNFALPRPFDYVYRVDVNQIRSEVTEASMLTRDENIVGVNLAVQFRVKSAEDFLFKVQDPEETMRQTSESAMRQVIGDNPMDFVLLEGRAEIAVQIRQILQDILDGYQTGLELTAVNLQDVRPPREVKDAFDDAIKAREDKERSKNEAEAYANSVVPEARGQAARIVQEAEAYKASMIARAEGESQRFNLLLAEYVKAPEVTRQRLYLEAMESVLGNASKVLVNVEGGNNVMYLPLDELMRSTAPALRRTATGADDGTGARTIATDELGGRPVGRRGREER